MYTTLLIAFNTKQSRKMVIKCTFVAKKTTDTQLSNFGNITSIKDFEK